MIFMKNAQNINQLSFCIRKSWYPTVCLFTSCVYPLIRHLCHIDIESPKIDCLSFVYVPATSAAHNSLLFCFFAAAVYSTNEENTRC